MSLNWDLTKCRNMYITKVRHRVLSRAVPAVYWREMEIRSGWLTSLIRSIGSIRRGEVIETGHLILSATRLVKSSFARV